MYNAEKYIANCLDSILNSDLPKDRYEIIVINDGSKDHGPEIAQRYAAEHSNITYFTQENQGQSVARNYGIRECHGQYVWCVDSDDRAVTAEIPKLFTLLCEHSDLDVLAVQLKVVKESGEFDSISCCQSDVAQRTKLRGRDAILQGYFPSSMCALIARTSFIRDNSLYFMPGITHQDVELSYRVMAKAKSVYFSDLLPYLYILHPNSTSQSVNPAKKIKYLSDEITVMKSFSELSQSLCVSDFELSICISRHVKSMQLGLVNNLRLHYKAKDASGIRRGVISKMQRAGIFPLRGNFGSIKRNVFAAYLNLVVKP